MKYPKRSKALKEYYKKHKRIPYERTLEHRNKMKQIKTGQTHGQETRKRISLHHHDVSGKNNPMYGKRGRLHPAWKGGLCEQNEILRKSLEYRLWREAIFKRDNWTCVWCGDRKSGKLNADHIKPWAEYPELRFALDNGRTLCEKCHKRTDTYAGRMNRTRL